MSIYHTRNSVPIEDLRRGKRAAARQEEAILTFFQSHPGMHTPWAVESATGILITSVRRAITNLTKEGKLEKVDHDRLEHFGVCNKCWRLVQKEGQQELFEKVA